MCCRCERENEKKKTNTNTIKNSNVKPSKSHLPLDDEVKVTKYQRHSFKEMLQSELGFYSYRSSFHSITKHSRIRRVMPITYTILAHVIDIYNFSICRRK